MHKTEFVGPCETLIGFFNKKFTQTTSDFWYREFSNVPSHYWQDAVIWACNNERYMPTVADMRRIVAKVRPKTVEEQGPAPDPVIDPKVERLNQVMFPMFTRFLKASAKSPRSKVEELFGIFMTELYGNAVREGAAELIDWEEFNGVYGFTVPVVWIHQAGGEL